MALRHHRLPRFWLLLTLGPVLAGLAAVYWWERQLPNQLRQAASEFPQPVCQEMIAFVAASKRGVCADPGRWNSGDSGDEGSTD